MLSSGFVFLSFTNRCWEGVGAGGGALMASLRLDLHPSVKGRSVTKNVQRFPPQQPVASRAHSLLLIFSCPRVLPPHHTRNRVRAFSWKSPRPLAVLRSHEKNVHAVAYSPRVGGLVSGSGDSRVAVWELFPNDKGRGDARRVD